MKERVKRLRAMFHRLDIGAFLVRNPAKVRYLTGFTGEDGLCLVTRKDSYLITDNRFKEQTEKEVKGSRIIIRTKSFSETMVERDLLAGVKRVGFESDVILDDYSKFYRTFPRTIPSLVDNLVDKLSAEKDETEIQKIQKAIELTEHIFEYHVLPQIKPGIRETDLAAEISYWGKKHGAEGDACPAIVASGHRSSLPHGYASVKKLERGDLVQFDFGFIVDGYCSDFSRVVVLGEPSEEQKKIHQIVLDAQEMALEAARPRMKCKNLDRVARNYLKKKGYNLPHGLGHGLGIMIHSLPSVSFSTEDRLKAGNVVTVEPGIYISGQGGIRLEDVIVITENGCRNLTKFPKDLIIK